MKIKTYVKKHIPDHKKIVQYQNINMFSRPTLKFIGINPTHKILLIGRKKRKVHSHKVDTKRNYENIALVLKDYSPTYIMSIITVVVCILTRHYI